MNESTRLTKMECILLGRLATKPMAGYDLHKWLTKEGPFFGYVPQPSQIYRQLGKMLDKGWVDLEIDRRDTGPDAKLYRLTADGFAAFRAWAESPYTPSVRPLDADFQMRMLLTGVLGPHIALRVLETELAYRRAQESASQPYQDDIDPDDAQFPIDMDWQRELVRTVGERSFLLGQTNLNWLEMTYARLAADAGSTSAADPTTPSHH
ncbi:PadR family transcriptional regulator [Streptomyces sp. NBC_01754]|uniref:PadR family transcriptional regulator n=1 Tax=Streptomyces sp. NBC_01754 TaxID=2975930 RepID=UPI002DD9A762|nr:PadR family transcriptional regulator [Streptomyces sp. NBC_01754]WSC96146.1 PadR family transcriptional regulator [Streptomyces sp. NBC_01754]